MNLPGAEKVGPLLALWGRLLVSICSVPSLDSSCLGGAPYKDKDKTLNELNLTQTFKKLEGVD